MGFVNRLMVDGLSVKYICSKGFSFKCNSTQRDVVADRMDDGSLIKLLFVLIYVLNERNRLINDGKSPLKTEAYRKIGGGTRTNKMS